MLIGIRWLRWTNQNREVITSKETFFMCDSVFLMWNWTKTVFVYSYSNGFSYSSLSANGAWKAKSRAPRKQNQKSFDSHSLNLSNNSFWECFQRSGQHCGNYCGLWRGLSFKTKKMCVIIWMSPNLLSLQLNSFAVFKKRSSNRLFSIRSICTILESWIVSYHASKADCLLGRHWIRAFTRSPCFGLSCCLPLAHEFKI